MMFSWWFFKVKFCKATIFNIVLSFKCFLSCFDPKHFGILSQSENPLGSVETSVRRISLFCNIHKIRMSIFKKNILIKYQIFTFFKLTQILVFSNIFHLFISWISIDLDIKIQKFVYQLCWVSVLFLRWKISKRQHPFWKKGIFFHNFFNFKGFHKKNHKFVTKKCRHSNNYY